MTALNNVCKQGLVERVAVIFFGNDNVPVERFIFKLTINLSSAASVEENQLEFALRSFLIKLSVAKPLVKPLPPSKCIFSPTIYFLDVTSYNDVFLCSKAFLTFAYSIQTVDGK